MSELPLRFVSNAIRDPSPDHVGSMSLPRENVISRCPLASGAMTKTSASPEPALLYAISVPSGDQDAPIETSDAFVAASGTRTETYRLSLGLNASVPRKRACARQRPSAGGVHETLVPGTDTRIRRLNCQPLSGSKRSISSSSTPASGAGLVPTVNVTAAPGATEGAETANVVAVSCRTTR